MVRLQLILPYSLKELADFSSEHLVDFSTYGTPYTDLNQFCNGNTCLFSFIYQAYTVIQSSLQQVNINYKSNIIVLHNRR
jgi:hypothetical protein